MTKQTAELQSLSFNLTDLAFTSIFTDTLTFCLSARRDRQAQTSMQFRFICVQIRNMSAFAFIIEQRGANMFRPFSLYFFSLKCNMRTLMIHTLCALDGKVLH